MTRTIQRVGVAGSGIMGSGIAQVVAQAGFDVVLRSRTQEKADATVGRLAKQFGKLVDKGKLSEDDRDAAMARVQAVTDLDDLSQCDLIIESVVEDLKVKQELLSDLDRRCGEGTILASNTSTLRIVELANGTERADRVCGVHFFNPATVMPLVEVVPACTTSEATVDAVRRFAEDLGKHPVLAKDHAGFIVNALLFPYLNGAVQMLDEGVATKEDIDLAMQDGCGFPMGPLALLDLIGLDTSVSILETLYDESRNPCAMPAPLLKRMVADGKLGKKSGEGFFTYD
ncbi:MAG: 3-hydroxyacyl-CoA dehydrogenase family protein [Acidimicrobiales bacterium]